MQTLRNILLYIRKKVFGTGMFYSQRKSISSCVIIIGAVNQYVVDKLPLTNMTSPKVWASLLFVALTGILVLCTMMSPQIGLRITDQLPSVIYNEGTQPHRRERWLPKDFNAEALGYLQKYEKAFVGQSGDPRRIKDVQSWWQAAALIDWYMNTKRRYRCKEVKNFGNWGACMDHPYTIKPPCLVYSFGIGYDFSFDDDMAAHGCEVHSFDPSMGLNDTERGERKYFYNMGLSSYSTNSFLARKDMYVRGQQHWKMKTLTAIKEMLGHTGRVIDVLKIDVEGHEWAVINNLIEAGELKQVRQFELEFHIFPRFPPKEDYLDMFKTYTKLREDLGFLEYSVAPHPCTIVKDKYNVQSDVQFVNSKFQNTSR